MWCFIDTEDNTRRRAQHGDGDGAAEIDSDAQRRALRRRLGHTGPLDGATAERAIGANPIERPGGTRRTGESQQHSGYCGKPQCPAYGFAPPTLYCGKVAGSVLKPAGT